MGPIEMRLARSDRSVSAASHNASRLRALEELVNVIASGRRSGVPKSSRMARMELSGMIVR